MAEPVGTEIRAEGEFSVQAWQTLVEEGNAAYIRRKLNDAELKFIAALRMVEKSCSADALKDLSAAEKEAANVRLTKSLNNMAALYHSQGKYSMAEDLYNRCLELKKKLYGDDHLEVAVNLHNLAVLNSARNRYAEAEEQYVRALELKERLLGAEHRDLVGLLTNYALLLKRLKKDEQSAAIEARALKIRQSKPVIKVTSET